MLASPRFIAIDDNLSHLQSILNSFESMGSYCAGIHFKPEDSFADKKALFKDARVIFLDFHLISSAAASDYTQHSAHIASLIEDIIHENSGPYFIVLWSSQSEAFETLKEYLTKNLDSSKPYLQPFGIFPLEKELFINLTSGETKNVVQLNVEIQRSLKKIPQLAVLMEWESDVLNSAGEVLCELKRLAISKSVEDIPASIDIVLSNLASAAAGEKHVSADPRVALNGAIGPILLDKILNQTISSDEQLLWDSAITKFSGKTALSDIEIAEYNKMLHLSLPSAEKLDSSNWGVCVTFPENKVFNDVLFDTDEKTIINSIIMDEFKIKADDINASELLLIKSGAACDHAQKQKGPKQYFLAIKVPSDTKASNTRSPVIWLSPSFKLGDAAPFRILVHARYSLSVSSAQASELKVLFRFREQLQNEMVTHLCNYTSRPGKIFLSN